MTCLEKELKSPFLKKQESSLKNLRIADIELFLTAAHLKSLGKAAGIHHLSQSAASAAILRVEESFNLPLCTHEKRQFRLTREGHALLHKLEKWIKQLKDLAAPYEELPIRLVTTHAIAQIAMPALLAIEKIDFQQMRPDLAYGAIIRGDADIALVLDNSPWKGVIATEIGKGHFRLFSKKEEAEVCPVLLPEDQMEVLSLQQSWLEVHGSTLPVKTRIPSWSLIANICASSSEVGFLPDFLASKFGLHPVSWQPDAHPYRVLAIYRNVNPSEQERYTKILRELRSVFS
jgi:DNA-binding transcriptional LysR family regulator